MSLLGADQLSAVNVHLSDLIALLDTEIGDAIGVSKQAAQQRWVPGASARFNERARNVVVIAHDRARSRDEERVGSEHLLLGLLGEPTSVAAKILVDWPVRQTRSSTPSRLLPRPSARTRAAISPPRNRSTCGTTTSAPSTSCSA
ncbi:MAG TPA: Clp protease N-terminal domain-containing protein [Pseudonocardiaceae bacterium]|nr:Clp protease N-terminal domain-containing protein [Pseudonocardiaceae bacterium]